MSQLSEHNRLTSRELLSNNRRAVGFGTSQLGLRMLTLRVSPNRQVGGEEGGRRVSKGVGAWGGGGGWESDLKGGEWGGQTYIKIKNRPSHPEIRKTVSVDRILRDY